MVALTCVVNGGQSPLGNLDNVLTISGVGRGGLVRDDCEGDDSRQRREGRAEPDHKVVERANFQNLRPDIINKSFSSKFCRRALALRSHSDPPEPNQPRWKKENVAKHLNDSTTNKDTKN